MTCIRPSTRRRAEAPKQGMEPTPSSVRSCLTSASGRGSCPALGGINVMLVYNRHNGHQATATSGWDTLLASAGEEGFRHAGESVETSECEG